MFLFKYIKGEVFFNERLLLKVCGVRRRLSILKMKIWVKKVFLFTFIST